MPGFPIDGHICIQCAGLLCFTEMLVVFQLITLVTAIFFTDVF